MGEGEVNSGLVGLLASRINVGLVRQVRPMVAYLYHYPLSATTFECNLLHSQSYKQLPVTVQYIAHQNDQNIFNTHPYDIRLQKHKLCRSHW